MTADEYILSDYAKERIELALLNMEWAKITLPETIDVCIKITNRLSGVKNDRAASRTVIKEMLGGFRDEDFYIIYAVLMGAYTIDYRFEIPRSILLENTASRFVSFSGSFAHGDRFILRDVSKYLDNSDLKESNEIKKLYPEYYYALCELIMIGIGKSRGPIDNSKQGIMTYGKNKYSLPTTGEGFYRAFRNIDLNNMKLEVRSMDSKNGKNWKKIITEISDDDAEVITWIHKQPNK